MSGVAAALQAAIPVFRERHELIRQRQAVIAASPEPQERELLKQAALTSAVADALRSRGVSDLAASIAEEVGAITCKIAFDRRVSESDKQDLSRLLRASLDQLKGIVAGT